MSRLLGDVVGVSSRLGVQVERGRAWLATSLTLALDSASRRRGLLGRRAFSRGEALLIAPSQGIHTFGLPFPIDVVGLTRDGRVVAIRPGVKPRRVALAFRAWAMLELPAGTVADAALRVGDVVQVRAVGPSTESTVYEP